MSVVPASNTITAKPTAAYRLDLLEHEYKLIMRLRQLRNKAEVDAVLVSLKPLQVYLIGDSETLEREKRPPSKSDSTAVPP